MNKKGTRHRREVKVVVQWVLIARRGRAGAAPRADVPNPVEGWVAKTDLLGCVDEELVLNVLAKGRVQLHLPLPPEKSRLANLVGNVDAP